MLLNDRYFVATILCMPLFFFLISIKYHYILRPDKWGVGRQTDNFPGPHRLNNCIIYRFNIIETFNGVVEMITNSSLYGRIEIFSIAFVGTYGTWILTPNFDWNLGSLMRWFDYVHQLFCWLLWCFCLPVSFLHYLGISSHTRTYANNKQPSIKIN